MTDEERLALAIDAAQLSFMTKLDGLEAKVDRLIALRTAPTQEVTTQDVTDTLNRIHDERKHP